MKAGATGLRPRARPRYGSILVVVVSLDPSKRAASVVTDGKPHRHGVRRPDLSAFALGLELEAVTAPGLDLYFQPRPSRGPFELERAMPVAPARPGWNRRGEGPDLESHDLGARMTPVAPRGDSSGVVPGPRAWHVQVRRARGRREAGSKDPGPGR